MTQQTSQPEIPIDTDIDSKIVMISDSLKNAKQILKNDTFTSPGEKLMDPFFGVGIKKYLFEPSSGVVFVEQSQINLSNFESTISDEIISQVSQYAPDVRINNISVTIEDNLMKLLLEYSYRNFIQDELQITIGP